MVAGLVPVRPELRHRLHRSAALPLALLLASLAACGRGRPGAEHGRVVDSVVPRAVALARFQAEGHQVDSLASNAHDATALVRGFVAALARRDTAALNAMRIDRDEFAFLYYPSTPQGMPPYDLAPSLLWFLLEGNSTKGLSRALGEWGGTPIRYVSHRCDSVPAVEGANRIWGPCMVRYVAPGGDTVEQRMFSQLIERDGRFKFLSYANKL